jgi:hypothetical protein
MERPTRRAHERAIGLEKRRARHRRLLGATLLIAAAALAGCGNRHLVVKVDILSYLDPSLTRVAFGPVPVVPGGIYTGEQSIVQDIDVNLVDGTNSVSEVQSVSIKMTAIARDSTGAGADTLRLYLSEPEVDPLTTTPAVTLPITLTSGVTDTLEVDMSSDWRVQDLFAGKRMRLTLTTALRGPQSGAPLHASVRVSGLDAVLVAGRKSSL